jgi:hypothetical protein
MLHFGAIKGDGLSFLFYIPSFLLCCDLSARRLSMAFLLWSLLLSEQVGGGGGWGF